MANDKMTAQMGGSAGFIAALDQSGGSTPGALRLYGIPDSAYSGDAEMFRLHARHARARHDGSGLHGSESHCRHLVRGHNGWRGERQTHTHIPVE